jgi:uncharacterized membrane protein YkoI
MGTASSHTAPGTTNRGEREMKRRTKLTAGGVAAIAIIGAGSALGIAAATGGDEQPLTGTTHDRAVAAALKYTGGGKVTETEVGDDGAAYEVEIQKADGSQVEVHLNSDFTVTGNEADDDGPNDQDGAGDD